MVNLTLTKYYGESYNSTKSKVFSKYKAFGIFRKISITMLHECKSYVIESYKLRSS